MNPLFRTRIDPGKDESGFMSQTATTTQSQLQL